MKGEMRTSLGGVFQNQFVGIIPGVQTSTGWNFQIMNSHIFQIAKVFDTPLQYWTISQLWQDGADVLPRSLSRVPHKDTWLKSCQLFSSTEPCHNRTGSIGKKLFAIQLRDG